MGREHCPTSNTTCQLMLRVYNWDYGMGGRMAKERGYAFFLVASFKEFENEFLLGGIIEEEAGRRPHESKMLNNMLASINLPLNPELQSKQTNGKKFVTDHTQMRIWVLKSSESVCI